MLREGAITKQVEMIVTREDILRYCLVIDENNSIYHCLETAKASGYVDLVIPATYPSLFWQMIEIPWLATMPSLIQSSQMFHYEKPLTANTLYTCFIVLEKIRQVKEQQFLQHTLYIKDNHQTVATSTTTLLVR